MYNVIEYLNSFEEKFLELFYSIRINNNQLYLQGYVNKETLIAVQYMGVPKINETFIEISYFTASGIDVRIVLTLETQ